MTIDEAIELLRNNNTILQEDLQIIEWLEELKDLREYQKRVEWTIKTQSQIRADAIDEFVSSLMNIDKTSGGLGIDMIDVFEVAEQLKEEKKNG